MRNNPCAENFHKMLIGDDEWTDMCPVCQDMDIFTILYTYDRVFLIVNEPS